MRYDVPWNGRVIEIDVYRGIHRGLVVAEVEFPNATRVIASNRRIGSAAKSQKADATAT